MLQFLKDRKRFYKDHWISLCLYYINAQFEAPLPRYPVRDAEPLRGDVRMTYMTKLTPLNHALGYTGGITIAEFAIAHVM
jgi:hypothetical protein